MTAVALFICNRPDTTARVFDEVRRARPERLFVFADRSASDTGDARARELAAQSMTMSVDWPCDVTRDFAEEHLGIKRRVESGLSLVFDAVEEAIVLEDDCLPHPSFFRFAGELLDRYRDDERVACICGSRLTPPVDGPASYVFSRYPSQWGWATWRRAWRWYDGSMHNWRRVRNTTWLKDLLEDPHAVSYWTYMFDRTLAAGHEGDWDTAWTCSAWMRAALAAIPSCNLVTNLGFDTAATHTRDPHHRFAAMPSHEMHFPLLHPDSVAASADEDRLAAAHVYSGNLARLLTMVRGRIRAGG